MPSEANVCEITFIVVIIDPMTLELEVMELRRSFIIYAKLAGGDSELQVGKAFFGEDGDVFH